MCYQFKTMAVNMEWGHCHPTSLGNIIHSHASNVAQGWGGESRAQLIHSLPGQNPPKWPLLNDF